MEGKEYGSQIITEFTVMSLSVSEQILDLKLSGKIVRFGLEKGIRTDEFIILRLYSTGAVKDWNSYTQINTEIRWRHDHNLSLIKQSRFKEVYEKAVDLKRFWDCNKIIPKITIAQKSQKKETDLMNKHL
jgi:hypothetical protein